MSERQSFVLNAPLGRALWSLSWPLTASNQLSILALGVLLFWFGRLGGQTALTVESLFRPFGFLVLWLLRSITVGVSVLVSRSVGAADGRGLSIAAAGMSLATTSCIVLAAIGLPFAWWLAGVLAGDLPVARLMLHYVIAFLVVALPGSTLGDLLLDVACATGATKFNLVRVLVDLAFMVALTPILMEVIGVGIAGGPIADGIAAGALVPVVWIALRRGRFRLGLGERERWTWRARLALWKAILVIGAPVQIGRVATFASQLIIVRLVMRDGVAGVAGYGVASALFLFGAMTTLALAQGSSILVGQALGAGLEERARRGVRAALFAGWSLIAVFVGVVTLFDRPIIGLFTSDAAVIAAAAHALGILCWAGFGLAGYQILLGAFAAYRATLAASLLTLVGEACGVVVAYSWPGSALDAGCIGTVVANVIKGAALLGLWATGKVTRSAELG